MAFLVEPGTGSSTANAYASVAAVESALLVIGQVPEAFAHATTADRERAIITVTAAIDDMWACRFRGERLSQSQALEWPRIACDDDGSPLVGVPAELVSAVAMGVVDELASPGAFAEDGKASVQSESVSLGPLSISKTYSGNSTSQSARRTVERAMRRLLYQRGHVARM